MGNNIVHKDALGNPIKIGDKVVMISTGRSPIFVYGIVTGWSNYMLNITFYHVNNNGITASRSSTKSPQKVIIFNYEEANNL